MPRLLILPVVALLGLSACDEAPSGVYRNLTGSQSCPEWSPIAQQYIYATPGLPARCGPQRQRPW